MENSQDRARKAHEERTGMVSKTIRIFNEDLLTLNKLAENHGGKAYAIRFLLTEYEKKKRRNK